MGKKQKIIKKRGKTIKVKKSAFHRIINPFPSNRSYWILFTIFALFYVISYSGVNVNCITYAKHDDLLYFNLAKSISEFNWLGDYNNLTLAKMPGFAMFLAFVMFTSIPYMIAISLFQVLAITFFLRNSMWIFKQTKLLSFVLGILLLFNPLFALQFRIYRLQLPAICFIIFLGVIISMFNPEQPKKRMVINIIDGLTAFLGFGFLFFTREENMIYYLLLIISIVSFLFVFKKFKNIKRNIFLPVIGISGFFLFWLTIATLNYRHYDRFVICERTSATFTNAIKAFNSVADDHLKPDYPSSSASREKIVAISEEVPEFRELGWYLYRGDQGWSSHSLYFDKKEMAFKKININDLPTSHFEFFWNDCVQAAGYYKDAVTLSDFYNVMAEKINEALNEGRLRKREVLISAGPYFISKLDIKTILKLIPVNYSYLFPGPKQIINEYSDVLARENDVVNKSDLLKWKRELKVNVIKNGDSQNVLKAKSTIFNKTWNLFVIIFAIIGGLIMQIAAPLAIFSFIFALIRRKWNHAILIFIITSGYIIFLIMLTILDVITGYDASIIMYYLPAYAAILISAFISVNMFITSKIIIAKTTI